jgi:hypothetical protein
VVPTAEPLRWRAVVRFAGTLAEGPDRGSGPRREDHPVQENVGDLDQRMRLVVGPALVLAALGPLGARRGRPVGLGALVAGALIVDSAISRTCPVNELLGIDTRAWDR